MVHDQGCKFRARAAYYCSSGSMPTNTSFTDARASTNTSPSDSRAVYHRSEDIARGDVGI